MDTGEMFSTLKAVRHVNRLHRESCPWKHSRSGWTGLRAPDVAVGVPVLCRGVGPDGP